MKYVHSIRRIMMLDNAINRLMTHDSYYDTERYDDIEVRLWAKRKMLSESLKEFTLCPDRTNRELRRYYANRRNQVKLACKLLGVDYYEIIRGY